MGALFNVRVPMDGPARFTVVNGGLDEIEIDGLQNYTDDEQAFFVVATRAMLGVLGSKEFHERATALRLKETNGQSLETVYQRVLVGEGTLDHHKAHALNFFVTMYYVNSNTMGYTDMGAKKIWTNSYYFDKWMKANDVASLAGHLFHEFLHTCGYYHRWSHTGTLVYEWGYLVRDMAKEAMVGRVWTPVRVG